MSDPAPTSVIGLNPFEPGFFDDPYAQYAAVRSSDPISHTALGPWLITRWADVHTLLRTPGTSVEERNIAIDGPTRREQLNEVRMSRGLEDQGRSLAILNIDPPDHTRIRKLVSKAFTPRAVEQIRLTARQLTDDLLDGLAQRAEPIDLISELAFPLPFAVINQMLGMPPGDSVQLRTWSHTITQVLDPLLVMQNGEAIIDAAVNMRGVIAEAIEWKRGRDDDDLLKALIVAEEEGETLTDAELVENVMLLFLAGHETTVNLIGNGTNALLDHPDQMRTLVEDPSLDVNAVEELLRWDSPVQFSRRIMLEPVEVAGVEFAPGDLVMTCLGAANRDPAKFGPTAGELDLRRPDAREHVSFGSGVHHCLGAALARLEGQEAIGRLVRRFPAIERAGTPTHNHRIVLRGYDHLPIALNP